MKSWPEVYIPSIDSRYIFPELSLQNTASQSIQVLPRKKMYRMYVCGITPYDSTHLGHAATYLSFDLINRYLRATGSKVLYVQNITDIDDPLLERASRDGIDWEELAHSQIDLFRSDMSTLHVIPPENYIGAVEAIPLVTKKIEQLKEAGAIYGVDKDLYFRVHSDPDFGTRSHLSNEESLKIFAERGGDPERLGKENPLDSLVWLAQRPNEPGWPSIHGLGRPGWHIECCAIALNYLLPEQDSDFLIDIQGGGSDLIFPHHEMSAAQARVSTGRRFAEFYVHTGMIGLDGQKMSKSLGNLVFVSSLVRSGVNPMVIRCALMMGDYTTDRLWNEELLLTAQTFLDSLTVQLSHNQCAQTSVLIQEIIQALSNNLDTKKVFALLADWISESSKGAEGGNPGELARTLDALLGIAI
ncbi:MAG: cysteine--1-D-myo-inosityl 2-amino-2-deoxy-alpha-D-glucopyranoside ligase [Actinobacteria bacterium]|uniref:L-cysteine:1D-myo-inositol 2-amino-2-deoxy-alpha-D-glucopyranoside ligase n=1 Tax=freshwater metagenome TaxID=449393 RepID=A0A6J6I3Q9_9ZZZZ|nr:cysteine--1-D-myo-inosityl 2-amino-2-deoxy-alpha-D-glucopyranoside ligase [Actinomycetota bacterium]